MTGTTKLLEADPTPGPRLRSASAGPALFLAIDVQSHYFGPPG